MQEIRWKKHKIKNIFFVDKNWTCRNSDILLLIFFNMRYFTLTLIEVNIEVSNFNDESFFISTKKRWLCLKWTLSVKYHFWQASVKGCECLCVCVTKLLRDPSMELVHIWRNDSCDTGRWLYLYGITLGHILRSPWRSNSPIFFKYAKFNEKHRKL